MAGTPLDVELVLFEEADLDAASDGNGTAVVLDGPGPYDAELHIAFSAASGTTPAAAISLDVSVDGGSSWVQTAALRSFTDDDEASDDESRFHYSRPVFIPGVPRPDDPAWSPAEPDPVQVRLVSNVTGDGGEFADFTAWLAIPDIGATSARRL